jgi:hypothetical protein
LSSSIGIVSDRENGAECAHFELLNPEDSHSSQHPSLYGCSAELLGIDFVDNIIGIGRVDVIARILGVAGNDPVDWVEWIRFRGTIHTVPRRSFNLFGLLAKTQFSERMEASRRTRREHHLQAAQSVPALRDYGFSS